RKSYSTIRIDFRQRIEEPSRRIIDDRKRGILSVEDVVDAEKWREAKSSCGRVLVREPYIRHRVRWIGEQVRVVREESARVRSLDCSEQSLRSLITQLA